MFRLRPQQMRGFLKHVRLRAFDAMARGRFVAFAPTDAAMLGPELPFAMRAVAERGFGWGIEDPSLLVTYVELGFVLGGLFDADRMLPWARTALEAPGDSASCMTALHAAAIEHIALVAGPQRAHALVAYERLATLCDRPTSELRDAGALFSWVFAERWARAGVPAAALVSWAREGAERRGLSPDAAPLVASTMLVLGHGVLDDPLMGWLCVELGEEPRAREAAFAARLRDYLTQARRSAAKGAMHGTR